MKSLLPLLLFVFLLGCREEKAPIPFPVFKNIIKDLHVAEAAVNTPGTPMHGASATDSMPKLNALVLEKYKINEATFRAGMAWYKERPELLDSAYNLVLADLSVMQSDINK